MADQITIKPTEVAPNKGAEKLPEANLSQRDGVTTVTVDSTPKPKETQQEQPKPAGDRPAWLPADFKTPEEFAAAYSKMAEKIKPPETKEAPKAPEDRKGAEELLQKSGLDMQDFSAEYAKDGKLSDASIAKLEKAGIKKATVDEFIEGQRARANEYKAGLEKLVGGPESLQETLKWAETALSPQEIAAANAALASMDASQAGLVLSGLHARRLAQTGVEPEFVSGRGVPARGDSRPYESTAEWMADVNSKQYRTDPAFREKVQRRVAVTQL